MSDGSAQLSCQQCRQGKKKCDKRVPCTPCQTSGVECQPVRRARLPRGRTAKAKKRNAALEDKVARLEGLLEKIEAQVAREIKLASPVNGGISDDRQKNDASRTTKVEDFVARDFWVTLSSEVLGLRETLEESDEEPLPQDSETTSPQSESNSTNSPHNLVFGHSTKGLPQTASAVTSPQIRDALLQIFKERVDVIYKVLHWPTVLSLLEHRNSSNFAAVSALENAICYMALCATTDTECYDLQVGDRAMLLGRYQSVTESSLASAKLLTTTDIVTLQAFLLYLIGLRCCMNGAATWTLLAMAVRIADGCGLFIEDPRLSPFDLQQQRRLRSGIGLLDSQIAFGRGTLPLLSIKDLGTAPVNINDSEMSRFGVQVTSSSSVTEMSFSSLSRQAMVTQRKICDPSVPSWSERLAIVNAFEQETMRDYGHLDFSPDRYQRYVANVARDIIGAINLLLRRPPYKNTGENVPASDNFDIMGTAVRVLESTMSKTYHDEFSLYRWFQWPKWYALAVLLVELLNVKYGPSHDHALDVARQSYAGHANSAADTQSSMSWKPITRLMRRVERTRLTHSNEGIIRQEDPLQPAQTHYPTYNPPLDVSTAVNPQLPQYYDDGGQASNAFGSAMDDLSMLDDTSWLQWDGFIDELGNPLGSLQVTMM